MAQTSTLDLLDGVEEIVAQVELNRERPSVVNKLAPEGGDWHPQRLEATITLSTEVNPKKPTIIDVNHSVTVKLFLYQIAEGAQWGARLREAYQWFDQLVEAFTRKSNIGLKGTVANSQLGIVPNPEGVPVVNIDDHGWLNVCITTSAVQMRPRT